MVVVDWVVVLVCVETTVWVPVVSGAVVDIAVLETICPDVVVKEVV